MIILILVVTALVAGLVLGFAGDMLGFSTRTSTTAIGATVGVVGAILISRRLGGK
jgi:hypothetical protein